MDIETKQLVEDLNHSNKEVRLEALSKLVRKNGSNWAEKTRASTDVNNHIHTSYSFSPYSPTKAVWMACNAGLATAGIMDHDSAGGAEEFTKAGKIAGIATTVGVECRADFSKTDLNGLRINNPDQSSVAYIAVHGIPHTQFGKVRDFFKPYTNYRNIRNKKMVERLNNLLESAGTVMQNSASETSGTVMRNPAAELTLDYEKDVIPLSMLHDGGSVTERHLLYALSLKLIGLFGKGPELLSFLTGKLKLNISPKIRGYLNDAENPHYAYDLLGLLKGELIGSIYIDAIEECPDVRDVIALSKSTGAILAYAYLGDVGNSVTGDKKAQKFEDSYIYMLSRVLCDLGFNAVTYMPSRNSMAQLDRVRSLCRQCGFFQISGEDINSSRQPFICEAMKNDSFKNLYDSAWALIGHELAATGRLEAGMFSGETVRKYPDMDQRVEIFKEIGLRAAAR